MKGWEPTGWGPTARAALLIVLDNTRTLGADLACAIAYSSWRTLAWGLA